MISKTLILASASARRADLLQAAGIDFRQLAIPHEEAIDELYQDALQLQIPLDAAKHAIKVVAEDKYRAALEFLQTGDLILTADTIVFCEEEILGKPADRDDAERMLRKLAGQAHQVLTAVCLGQGVAYESFVVESAVSFHPYDYDLPALESYLAKGRALEYAGAYGIQDPDFPLLAEMHGSLSNVIGLPLEETLEKLRLLMSL